MQARLIRTVALQERREAIASTPFAMRLQSAQAKHSADLAELHARLYAAPRAELSKQDFESVQAYFTSCTGDEKFPENVQERDSKLNEMIDDSQVVHLSKFILCSVLVPPDVHTVIATAQHVQ